MFPVVLSGAVALGAAVLTSNEASYIKLVPSTSSILAGDEFYIDVYAYAHVPVNAVDITVTYDTKAVEVTAIDVGQSVLTVWTEEPTFGGGTIELRGGTFRYGFIEEHKIARIDLRGKRTGMSSFSAEDVLLLAGDGAGTELAVREAEGTNVNLFIYDENTDPGEIAVFFEVSIVTDLNNDGKVTLKDVSAFMAAWHNKTQLYDFNNDGRMTFRDFSILLSDYFFK